MPSSSAGRLAALASAVLLATALTACAGEDETEAQAGSSPALEVASAFYPLAYAASRVGGDLVEVTTLTAPGAEPHDLELTPKQVAGLGDTDLVVYLEDFQPAVDEAVEQQAEDAAFDVGTVTPLEAGYVPLEDGEAHEDEEGKDPHVWLDPMRYAAIGDAVAARMAELSPDSAQTFTANAQALRTDLEALDAELRSGLGSCERKEIVTSHNAFGYLARAYGLEQVSLAGLTPDTEPSPKRLAEVARYATSKDVTTIFFEDQASPAVAESLAREVGAKAAQLSPLEGPPEQGDYLTQMRVNLATLQTALGCSAT